MILKHRDRELLRFEWIEPNGVHIVSVNNVEILMAATGLDSRNVQAT